MINKTIRISVIALLGIGVAAATGTAAIANSTGSIQCGVVETSEGGMLALEGTILSPVALSGEYKFAIRSSGNGGSSNISQGGYFSVEANRATAVGKVLINASSNYDIDFDVTADGQKLDCSHVSTIS